MIKGFKKNGEIIKYDYNSLENLPKENGNSGINVAVDETLTKSGMAADSAVVGQKLTEIDSLAFDAITGKNLVNPDTCIQGFLDGANNVDVAGVFESYETSDYIQVEKETDYSFVVFSFNNMNVIESRHSIVFYDSDKAILSDMRINKDGVTITTFNTGSAKYVRVCGRTEKYTSNFNKKMQLEIGLTFTSFEEYTVNNKKLKNPNPDILYGKKWVVFGDSFTNGGYAGSGIDETEHKFQNGKYKGRNITYPYIIGERNNMEIVKRFDGGKTLANPASGTFTNSITNPNSESYYQNIPEDVDYITIYLGINDEHHESGTSGSDGEDVTGVIPLGTINDQDTSTFYGAWNVVLPWLMTNRPHAHIGIIVSNGVGKVEYRTATIEVAKKWGIPYLDLNGDERCPAMIRTINPDISDEAKSILLNKWRVSETNTHPNTDAQRFQSTFIENFLRSL